MTLCEGRAYEVKGIFFIVGSGRSGTNLCASMLNLHPELRVVGETHFLRTLVRLCNEKPPTVDQFVTIISEHYTSDGDKRWVDFHLEAGQRDPRTFVREFRYFCKERQAAGIRALSEAFFDFCYGEGDYLVGDKTPLYGLHMDELQSVWPEAKFIHLLRDGRDVAWSMRRHMGFVSSLYPRKVRQMTVVGSKKMVVYDDIAEHTIAIYDKGIDPKAELGKNMDFDHPGLMQYTHRSRDVLLPKIDWKEPLKTEVEQFVDCVLNGTPCITGPSHARQVARILASSRHGEV